MSLLFLRYVAGQITETRWSSLAALLDDTDATVTERDALARFFLDTAADAPLPTLPEVTDLLTEMRA
ncbi:MAG: hypothetical protein AAGG50_07290 [Bacteroidota bacterium]